MTATTSRQRRPNLNFQEMGWREGDLLSIPKFKKYATVAGPKTVKFGRSKMSISAVFAKLDGRAGRTKIKVINTRTVETMIDAHKRTYP